MSDPTTSRTTPDDSPPRDVVERLIERRDGISLEAAEIIMGIRGANKRLRQMLREIRELP